MITDSNNTICPRCGLAPATPSGIGHAILCRPRPVEQDNAPQETRPLMDGYSEPTA